MNRYAIFLYIFGITLSPQLNAGGACSKGSSAQPPKSPKATVVHVTHNVTHIHNHNVGHVAVIQGAPVQLNQPQLPALAVVKAAVAQHVVMPRAQAQVAPQPTAEVEDKQKAEEARKAEIKVARKEFAGLIDSVSAKGKISSADKEKANELISQIYSNRSPNEDYSDEQNQWLGLQIQIQQRKLAKQLSSPKKGAKRKKKLKASKTKT